MVISKLVKPETNSPYLNGYSRRVIRMLVLVLPKLSEYGKTFKVKDWDNIKNKELMSFCIYDEKLLEKYKSIFWIKIEDWKNFELNALPVYDDRYIKIKIRRYGDKIYTFMV